MKISPLREGLAEYLDEEQLYTLKKQLDVELKLLKFLSIHKVADTDCVAFARDDNNEYIYPEKSARFYANKHGRTLYDEELIDIYLVKFNNDRGRGENIFVINENGLRLLGINEEFEMGLNELEKVLQKTQYSVCRKEQLLKEGFRVLNISQTKFYINIKYADNEDIFNEYIFADDNKFILRFNHFLKIHNPYNDIYTVLIDEKVRSKELASVIGKSLNPIILNKKYSFIHKRNSRNQNTFRPNLEIMGGY